MKTPAHPARSADFLSRLHDGELEPSERAQFEAHRAHCAECRAAASQFESALAFFRASRPNPPPPDLSARILRRLQASTLRRSPLGRSFGIDLKWAGAFAAALIAVIVGSSIVLEREARHRAAVAREAGPIAVVVERAKPAAPAPLPGAETKDRRVALEGDLSPRGAPAPRAAPKSAESSSRPSFARPGLQRDALADKAEEAPVEVAQTQALDRAAAAPPARPERKEMQKLAGASRNAQETAAQPLPRQEQSGGEGAATQARAAEPGPVAPRVRVIAPPDGRSASPVLLNAGSLNLTEADRGEYQLLVRNDGSVASVQRLASREKSRRADVSENDELKKLKFAPTEELKKLRFQASERPRQLLVRVE